MAQKSSLIVSKSNAALVANCLKSHYEISKRHPDAVLLYRIGEHYALIGKCAQASMRDLDILPVNFAIVPDQTEMPHISNANIKVVSFRADELDTYLPRLVRAGHRVAIITNNARPLPNFGADPLRMCGWLRCHKSESGRELLTDEQDDLADPTATSPLNLGFP